MARKGDVRNMYRQLDAQRIIETADRLCRRISERFPDSGLARVGEELLAVASAAEATAQWVARPLRALRIAVGACVAGLVAITTGTATWIAVQRGANSWAEFAQGLDAALNVAILVSAAIFFLITLETRIKRRRALKALHELRVLAHVVEMHQLTKDPERLVFPGPTTPSSPAFELTAFELTRYLDYCSDMLVLIGNLAALQAQRYDDPVALDAVDAVERLTTGISQKIWQKMTIINAAILPQRRNQPGRE